MAGAPPHSEKTLPPKFSSLHGSPSLSLSLSLTPCPLPFRACNNNNNNILIARIWSFFPQKLEKLVEFTLGKNKKSKKN
jgi:hypothetical protein